MEEGRRKTDSIVVEESGLSWIDFEAQEEIYSSNQNRAASAMSHGFDLDLGLDSGL